MSLKFNVILFIAADENDSIGFAGRNGGRARHPRSCLYFRCDKDDPAEHADSIGSSFLRPEELKTKFKKFKSKGETNHDEHNLQPNRN